MEKNEILDVYKKYISEGWFDSTISFADIERWVENFEESKKEESGFNPLVCAKFLLDALVFYHSKHVPAIIYSFLDKLKSRVNQEEEKKIGRRLTETEIDMAWQQFKNECFICPVAGIEDAGTSAHQSVREWRNASGIDTGTIAQLNNAIVLKGKKHIIFVDDIIGTGNKMDKFLSNPHFPNEETYGFSRVNNLMCCHSDHVDFTVAVYALCEKGHIRLKDNYENLRFLYADYYTEQYDLLSEACILYDAFENDKQGIIEYIRKKQNELNGDSPYALNIPVAFEHGCPNNSLALYYKSNEHWANLLEETHPVNL